MQEAGRWGARKARGENENGNACRVAKARAVHVSAPDGPDLAEKKNRGRGGSAGRDEFNFFSGEGVLAHQCPKLQGRC